MVFSMDCVLVCGQRIQASLIEWPRLLMYVEILHVHNHLIAILLYILVVMLL